MGCYCVVKNFVKINGVKVIWGVNEILPVLSTFFI